MLVHVFGAYFGLAVSFVLKRDYKSSKNGPTYTSDTFAMIGIVYFDKLLTESVFFSMQTTFIANRNNFPLAILAQFQLRTGRRRRPAPFRHQHLFLPGCLLRHCLCRLRSSQQRQ